METGVIFLLDAVGVKGIWRREKPETFVSNWEKTIDQFEYRVEPYKAFREALQLEEIPEIRVYAFSDTIIITMKTKEPKHHIAPLAQLFVQPYVDAIKRGVFLRGVLSIGEFHQSNRMVIGPAIDEAAEWYEYHDWIGVALTPTACFAYEVGRGVRSPDALPL